LYRGHSETSTLDWVAMLVSEEALQACINHVAAAYSAADHLRVSFTRHTSVTSGAISIDDTRALSVTLPADEVPSISEAQRIVIRVSPAFNPFRELSLNGYWYDWRGLRMTITEGRSLQHVVPSAAELSVNAVAFGFAHYSVFPVEQPGRDVQAFDIQPTNVYRSEATLWLRYAQFTSTCEPEVVILEGPNDRELTFQYTKSPFSVPLIGRMTFAETLPRTHQPLSLVADFSKMQVDAPK